MLRSSFMVFICLFIFFACSENSTNEPDTSSNNIAENVFGKYSTTTFILTRGDDQPLDIFELGSYVDIELHSNNTCTGVFFVPDTMGLSPDGAQSYDLQGTFSIENDTLQFNQNADTFIRNIKWETTNLSLIGKYENPSVKVELTLSKLD